MNRSPPRATTSTCPRRQIQLHIDRDGILYESYLRVDVLHDHVKRLSEEVRVALQPQQAGFKELQVLVAQALVAAERQVEDAAGKTVGRTRSVGQPGRAELRRHGGEERVTKSQGRGAGELVQGQRAVDEVVVRQDTHLITIHKKRNAMWNTIACR